MSLCALSHEKTPINVHYQICSIGTNKNYLHISMSKYKVMNTEKIKKKQILYLKIIYVCNLVPNTIKVKYKKKSHVIFNKYKKKIFAHISTSIYSGKYRRNQ